MSLNLQNLLGQWQGYAFTGQEWAKTPTNVAALAAGQPACTLFAIVRHSTSTLKQVLFSVGAMGTGNAHGLVLSAANKYEPWVGREEAWTGCVQTNSAADTWRSVAVVWAASSNTATMYVNAVSVGTGSNTRNYVQGPAVLGAAIDGSQQANPYNLTTNSNLAHVQLFAGALTLAQVKAIHNLVGYQYGLAVVP